MLSTKNTDKPYIMIPNAIVRNNGISNVSKMIYTSLAMSRNIKQTRLFQPTSINGLCSIAGYKQRAENQNIIKEALVELVELNFIGIYSDLALSKKIRPLDLKGITMFFVQFNGEYVYSEEFINQFDADDKLDTDLIRCGLTYTTVYVDDAVKLFAFESKHNRANIIAFYLMAVSRALIGDKGDKYSTEDIESITYYANINEKTASTYIIALFNAQLLFKVTMREIKPKTGEIKDHNVYTRWSDSEVITWEIERNDWFMKMTLLRIGDKELSDEQRKYIKNKARKLNGLSEVY